MNAIETLEAVLCDPEGCVCISGSDGDRREIQEALHQLRADLATCQRELLVMTNLRDAEHDAYLRQKERAEQAEREIDYMHGVALGEFGKQKLTATETLLARYREALVAWVEADEAENDHAYYRALEAARNILAIPTPQAALNEAIAKAIPDEIKRPATRTLEAYGYVNGWNDCRKAVIQTNELRGK